MSTEQTGSPKAILKKTLLPLPSSLSDSASNNDPVNSLSDVTPFVDDGISYDHQCYDENAPNDGHIVNSQSSNFNQFASCSGFLNPIQTSQNSMVTSLPPPDMFPRKAIETDMNIGSMNKMSLLSLPDSDLSGSNNFFLSESASSIPPKTALLPPPTSLNSNLPPPSSLNPMALVDNPMNKPFANSVPTPGTVNTNVRPPGPLNANIPAPGTLNTNIPYPGTLNTNIPPPGTINTNIPPPGAVNTNIPPPGSVNTNVPPPVSIQTNIPSQTILNSNASVNILPQSLDTSIPPPIPLNANMPPPGHINTKLPPPANINVAAPPPDLDTSKPPPYGMDLASSNANFKNISTVLPPPNSLNISVPPPGLVNTGLPPPTSLSNIPPMDMSLPPPNYHDRSSNQENQNKSKYLQELKEWYKQIEDYESQMLSYFEKSAENLREWHKNGGDQTDEYRVQYTKLTVEYDNYIEYMKTFKSYYDQQVAEAKELSKTVEESKGSDPNITASTSLTTITCPFVASVPANSTVETPNSMSVDTSSNQAVSVSSFSTSTVVTSSCNDCVSAPTSVVKTETITSTPSSAATMGYNDVPPPPPDTASLSLTELQPLQNENEDSSGTTSYYISYYKQMIEYFSKLLETMGQSAPLPSESTGPQSQQPPPPPPPPQDEDTDSGDSSDESGDASKPKLSRNQKKKLKKKKNQQSQHKTKKERKLEKQKNATQKSEHEVQSFPPFAPSFFQNAPPGFKPPPVQPSFNPSMPPPGYQPPVLNMEPQATMKMCLDQMSYAGRWDWASWNMYMNNIAQSNPQWYNIFQQFSHSMGLNFSEMSQKGSSAISYPPQQQNSKNPPVSNDSNKQTIFSKLPESSPIKLAKPDSNKPEAEDSDSDEPSDKSQPKWCKDCEQSFSNYHAYTLHLRGIKHMHNALDRAKKNNPEQFAEETERERKANEEDLAKEKKHLEWVLNQYKSEKRKGLGISGSFYCTLCNVECTSEKALQFHLNGSKHTKNLEQVMQTGKKENQHKKSGSQKVIVRIQKILDNCLEALIGLEYILEYQREDPLAECRYYCELCDHRFDPASFIGHVTSIKHRKTYMKYNFYDMYEILDQDNSNKSAKAKRINIFARKIEEYEGRKKLSVRMEISNPELKAQKLKEAEEKRKEKELKEQQRLAEARQAVLKLREERRAKRIVEKKERMEAAKRLEEHIKEQERLDIKYAAHEDMEEGEILSDEEEEPSKSLINSKKTSRRRQYSSSDSDSFSDSNKERSRKSSVNLSDDSDEVDIETEVREEEQRRRKLEEAASKDDDNEDDLGKEFNDFEMAEFEDLSSADKRPLAIQLKEDHDRDDFIRRLKEKKMLKLKEADKESLAHFVFEADWVLERCKVEEAARKAKLEEEKEKKRLEAEKRKEAEKEKTQSESSKNSKDASSKQYLLPTLTDNFGPTKPPDDTFSSPMSGPPPTSWSDMSLMMTQFSGGGGPSPATGSKGNILPPSFAHSRKIAEEFNRKVQMGENPFSDPIFCQQQETLEGSSATKRKLGAISESAIESKKICLSTGSESSHSRPLLPTPVETDKSQPPFKKTLLSTPPVLLDQSAIKLKPNATYGLIPDYDESRLVTQNSPMDQRISKMKPSTPLLPLPVDNSNSVASSVDRLSNLTEEKTIAEPEAKMLLPLPSNEAVSDKIQSVLNTLNLSDINFAGNISNETSQLTGEKVVNSVGKKSSVPLLPLPLPLPNSDVQDMNKSQRSAPLLPIPEKVSKPTGGLLPTPQSDGLFLPSPEMIPPIIGNSSSASPSSRLQRPDKPLLPLPSDDADNATVPIGDAVFKRPQQPPPIHFDQNNEKQLPVSQEIRLEKSLISIPPGDMNISHFHEASHSNLKRSNRSLLPLPSQLMNDKVDNENSKSLLPLCGDVSESSMTEDVNKNFNSIQENVDFKTDEEFTQFRKIIPYEDNNQSTFSPNSETNKYTNNDSLFLDSNQKIGLPSRMSILKRQERPLLSSDVPAFNEDDEYEMSTPGQQRQSPYREFESNASRSEMFSKPPSAHLSIFEEQQYEPDNVVRYPGLDYPNRPAPRILQPTKSCEEPLPKSLLPTPDIPMLRPNKRSEFAPPRDYFSDRKKRYDWSGLDLDMSYTVDKNKSASYRKGLSPSNRQSSDESYDQSSRKISERHGKNLSARPVDFHSPTHSRKIRGDRHVSRNKPYDYPQNRNRNRHQQYHSRGENLLASNNQEFHEKPHEPTGFQVPCGLENLDVNMDELKAILQGVSNTSGPMNEKSQFRPSEDSRSSRSKPHPFVSRLDWSSETRAPVTHVNLPHDRRKTGRNEKRPQLKKPRKDDRSRR